MKVGLIVPNNIWFCPYVSIYTKLLTELAVDYELLSWNRSGVKEEGLQFEYKLSSRYRLSLLLAYYKFSLFVKKKVIERGYDKLIVFTPQSGIFLAHFLQKRFDGNYIFDYRDLSIEQMPLFKRPFRKLLSHSYLNVISSPGFKKYLPNSFDYQLSHNFDINVVQDSLNQLGRHELSSATINVLTIGGIRDYESNVLVEDALANKPNVNLFFVGRGPSAGALEEHAKYLGANNIFFEGYYPKEEEKNYIEKCTFLNIFYPRRPSHDSALSNRFYNSLIYRRPMIVTADTTQGDYVEKYGLGLAIKSCDNLDNQMKSFINNLSMERYDNNCRRLLSSFLEDYETFREKLVSFMK